MSRIEAETPAFRIGRVMLTATELAGLAECEAASRSETSGFEDGHDEEGLIRLYEGSHNGEDITNVGKKPTRQKYILRHDPRPDPETGTQILTRRPHRHNRSEEWVAESRRAARRRFKRYYGWRNKPYTPGWRLRAPEMSDWDTSG